MSKVKHAKLETMKDRGMKFFTKIYYRTYIAYLAIRWIFQINLGNKVTYKGKIYWVDNGVISGCWTLSPEDRKGARLEYIPREECKLVLTPLNLHRSFRYGYWFYMTSWYQIWCNQGIEPWVKALPIWPRKKN